MKKTKIKLKNTPRVKQFNRDLKKGALLVEKYRKYKKENKGSALGYLEWLDSKHR